jgi:phthiodiolone/phenolphthiodiolone dimycocerosates ketoreductase
VAKPGSITVGTGIPPRPPASLIRGAVDAARAAGIDRLWCIDHFTSFVPSSIWDETFTPIAIPGSSADEMYEVQTVLGYVASLAGPMGIGAGVTEAIRRHPVVLAQAFLTLTHLAEGPVALGIGAGERENVDPYGLDFRGQVSRLAEALEIIRMCFTSRGEVDYEGRFFSLDRAILDLEPGPSGPPEIWIAAHGPRMLELVGAFGDGWYPTHLMTPEEYALKLAVIRGAAAAHGRVPDSVTPGLQAFIAVAEDDDGARQLLEKRPVKLMALLASSAVWNDFGAEHPLGENFGGLTDFVPQNYDRVTMDRALAAVPADLLESQVICGTPDEVVHRVHELAVAGLEHIVLNVVPGLAHRPPQDPCSVFSLCRAIKG